MSWYNNIADNTFIDATQQLNIAKSLIINQGDVIINNIGEETTINDLINIKQDANNHYQVYINNNNEEGEIRFYTKNAMNVNDYNYNILTGQYSEPRLTYNTKINKDGILEVYHTYNILSPQKISGWYSIDGSISALETEILLVATGLATNSALIIENQTAFSTFLTTDYTPFKTSTAQNFVAIYEILSYLQGGRNITNWYNSGRVQDLLDSIINTMPDGTSIVRIGGETGNFNYIPQVAINVTELFATKTNAFGTFVDKLGQGLTYAGIGAGIYALYQMIDKENENKTNETIILVANLRNYIAEQIAQGNTSEYQTNKYIWVDGLTIQETTNNNFTKVGLYIVEIQKNAELEITISQNTEGVLIANITNIIKFGSGFSLNENIYVNKSNIGGTTGQLNIIVTQLRSLEYILEYIDNKASQESNNILNRQRRRQNIPNKNDFTDGLEIVESSTSQENGEVLPKIEIKLKLNTEQFEYDNSGNLQLKDYNIINTNKDNITTLQDNVLYKGFITDYEDSRFQLEPQYENGEIVNYKLKSILLERVGLFLGVPNPDDTETAFQKIANNKINIATNKTDISTIKTDIANLQTTHSGNIEDIRDIIGYDDNSILYLLLPKNETGQPQSISQNLAQNKGLLDIGYKSNDLAFNYDDYFDVLFIIPKFSKNMTNTQNQFQENMVNNNYVLTTDNFSIITDYNNFTTQMSGLIQFTLPFTDYLGVSFYANFYNFQDFKKVLEYKNVSVFLKQNLLQITYSARQTNYKTLLNGTYNNDLQIGLSDDLNLNLNNFYLVHKITSGDDFIINAMYIINSLTYTDYFLYSVSYDIFSSPLGLNGGYDLYNQSPVFVSNDAFIIAFNDDVIVNKLNISIARKWLYYGDFITPYEPKARIKVYITNTLDNILHNETTQILLHDFKSLGSTQYQSVTNFNLFDPFQNQSCRYLKIQIEQNFHQNDNQPLSICFLNINSLYTYYTLTNITKEAPINIPNQESHLVINKNDIDKKLDFYINGNITTIYYPDIYFTNSVYSSFVNFGNNFDYYTYRMLGINKTNISPDNFANIKLLNDNTRSVNIDRLTTMEDLYVKSNLVCKNLQIINDTGSVLSFTEQQTTSGGRRAMISDTTYTLLDEIEIPTPPTENAFIYYDTTLSKLSTRTDVVRTEHILDVVRDGDILDVVRDGDILDVVRTEHILDVVRDGDILDVVRDGDILDVVRDGDILDVVRDGDILDVVRDGDILDVVRDGDILDVVRTGNINNSSLEIDENGALNVKNSIQYSEAKVNTLLSSKNYLTSIPAEYITETELSQSAGTNVSWNAGTKKFDVLNVVKNGDIGFSLGNGTLFTIPTITLRGNNGVPISSQIIFTDNYIGTSPYYQGMAMYFNSSANTFHISGDNNNDTIIDSPPHFTIRRIDGNVGIGTTNPVKKLSVIGDINVSGNYFINGVAINNFSGAYADLTGKPTLFDGNYNSLINKPTLFDGNYNSLINKPTLFDGNYSSLIGKPDLTQYQLITDAFSGNYNDLSGLPVLFDGNYNSLINLPNLTQYQLITDAFSGNYNDLNGLPTLFDGNYNSLINLPTLFNGDYNSLINKPALFNGDYNLLQNLPDLSVYSTFSGSYNDLANLPNLSVYSTFTGNYNDLNGLPTLFDGNYSSLIGTPTLFDGNYNSLINLPNLSIYSTFTGNYNDLTNKPTLFNRDYNNLINLPTLFNGDYNSLINKPALFNGDYNLLQNLPDLSVYSTFSGSYTDLANLPNLSVYSTFTGNYNDLNGLPVLFDGNYNSLYNKPDLTIYSTFTGNYNDLTNKPTLFSGSYVDLTNKPTLFSGSYVDLTNIPTDIIKFSNLDTTIYSPTTTQTQCDIILYEDATYDLVRGRFWVDRPLKFTPAQPPAGPIGQYLPPYISLDINTTTLEIDVNGKLNVIGGGSGSLSYGMSVQTKHLTYTKMDVKNNTGWEPINDSLTDGFVIAIQPTNTASKILVNTIVQIGANTATDSRWWGIKLYRKIGTGAWTEVTGANGSETGAGASTAGTPVWITNNMGMTGSDYQYFLTSASGTYLDAPNTTQIVYYTAYWNARVGDGANNVTGNFYLNRANTQNDAYRPAPSSSWTATEIWQSGTPYVPPPSGAITIANNNVGISNVNPLYKLHIKMLYDQIASGLHLDASDDGTGNQYTLTTYPYVVGAGAVGWRYILKNGGSAITALQLNHVGDALFIGNIENPRFKISQESNNAVLRVNSQGEGNYSFIKLATPFTGSMSLKSNVVLQAIAKSTYSRADFVIGVGNSTDNSSSFDPYDTYWQRMRIYYNSYTEFFGTGNSGTINTYYYGDNPNGGYLSTSWNVSTKHNGAVWTTNYFVSTSDRDIKKDIEELNDDECLNKILLLKPCKYRYIDKTKNTSPNKTYGYIAQEVAEVLPEAVRYEAEYIPNALCFVNINDNIITIDSVRPDTYTLILKVGLKIKLIDESDNIVLNEITEVIDENTFKVDTEIKYDKLFLYGSLKDDFNVLAKEYINAVHVSATQELHRIITKQQEKINELENKLANVLAHLGI